MTTLAQDVLISKQQIPPDLLEFFEPAECGECYICKMVAVFREVRRVLRKDGTLWLNLGDSYATGTTSDRTPTQTGKHGYWENPAVNKRIDGREIGLKPKNLVGIPWRVAFALQADGWYLRSDIIWSKPNSMPESVTDRPTKAHEYLFLLSKSERYFYDAGGRNRRTVWEIVTQPFPSAHFATFPEALVKPCILAGTSERGCCSAIVKRLKLRDDLPPERREKAIAYLKQKGLV